MTGMVVGAPVVASASTLEPRVDNHQLNNESIITLHVNSIDEPSLRARYTSFNFQTKSFFLTTAITEERIQIVI